MKGCLDLDSFLDEVIRAAILERRKKQGEEIVIFADAEKHIVYIDSYLSKYMYHRMSYMAFDTRFPLLTRQLKFEVWMHIYGRRRS